MVLGRNYNQQVTVTVGNSAIENTEEEKLLGVAIDKQLNFETHITKLCQKAGNKLFALARISKYMDSDKLRILMRCFVINQFQYCLLAWMFHSRHLNKEIDEIHEMALKIAYKDYESTIFAKTLEKKPHIFPLLFPFPLTMLVSCAITQCTTKQPNRFPSRLVIIFLDQHCSGGAGGAEKSKR